MPATANNHDIIAATIDEPHGGLWLADIEVDHSQPLTGAVQLAIDGVAFRGTAIRSGMHAGRSISRIVGGTGGLRQPVASRYYRSAQARLIIEQIIADAAEQLSSTSDEMSQLIPRWMRAAGTAGQALSSITDHLGIGWRVGRDGAVCVCADTWPALELEHTRINDDPRRDAVEIAPHDGPLLRPGVTFDGRRVSHVRTSVKGRILRQAALFDADAEESRLMGALRRMVETTVARAMANRPLDYRALYPASIIAQHSDGTVDLRPDDERVGHDTGGLTHVPLLYGAPGWTAEIPAGTRVLLGFEAGDPSRPYAALWRAGAVTQIAFDGGNAAVGRVGDAVDIGAWSITIAPATGAVTAINVIPPGGGAPVSIPVTPATVELAAEIAAGNTKFLA